MSSVPSTSAIDPPVATHPSTLLAAADPPSAAKPATTAPRFKVGGSHDQEFDVHDVQALCHLPPLTITSPNVGWLLHPFLFEDQPVQARADDRFGTVDIYQWLQLYNG
ncbi:hypothetical protein BDN67DRAFT_1017211 [Paxillus ammoniavirescens]|nr:hypothetical protein BDN67DRAFT_1017211 [Paxillus ammoniavirescens]